MKHLTSLVLIMVVSLAGVVRGQLLPDLGGQRVGISAAQFLKIGVGARAVAMGESYVAVADDAEALYWNPAGLALSGESSAIFAHTRWVVDVQLEFVGVVHRFGGGNTLGASITYLHTEDMQETTELQPFGTGRMFGFSDFLAGLSYARKMTDKFSFGLTVKYMQESLAELRMRSVLFDLGTHYDTGWRSTRFAISVANFGNDMSPSGTVMYKDLSNQPVEVSSFQSFAPPTVFRIGIAGEVFDSDEHRITTSIQLNHPNDNTENVNFGAEYSWNELLALRAGYKTSQAEESFSAGFGIDVPAAFAGLQLDYAYTNFGRLGNVNRFSLQLKL